VVGKICGDSTVVNAVDYHPDLSPDQIQAVKQIRARQLMRIEDCMHLSNFKSDVIHGYVPIMDRGMLGLRKPVEMPVGVDKSDIMHQDDLALNVVLAGPSPTRTPE
jgi:hypothetical protein